MEKRFLAYLSALGAALFYSLNQIFNKRVVLALGTLPALTLVYAVLTAVDFLLCAVFGNFSVPSQGVLLEIIFLSAMGVISILTLFESFKHLPIGVSITLANLSPVFLTALVFLFTGRFPSLLKLFSIALILFAVYLITSEGERFKVSKRVYLLPIATALGWSIFGWEVYRLLNIYRLDIFALAFSTSFYMFSVFFAAFIALYGKNASLLLRRVKSERKILQWAFWGGSLTSFGFILSMVPFKWIPPEEAPVIEAIFTTTTPLSALFSYLFAGERLTKRQTVGIILAFLALVLFFVT